ncbi:hypothetical protein ACHAXT_003203 [Thalassiosira profunda]
MAVRHGLVCVICLGLIVACSTAFTLGKLGAPTSHRDGRLHAKKSSKQKKSSSKKKQIRVDIWLWRGGDGPKVVRARYSAYAKREVDFIVGSTHPLNEKFQSDIEHWKEQIKINCYDNFELTSCEIVDESYEGEGDKEIAKVNFVAKMTQVDSREKTAFMETSTFERAGQHIAGGAWLYKEGVIETAPGMPEPEEEEEESEDAEEGVKEGEMAA